MAATLMLSTAITGCGGDDEAASTTTSAAMTSSSTAALPAPTQALVIAHRGASGSAPEHTFAAYDLAVEAGADYIEQDLQMTADGVLVALHDDTLDRTARGPAENCTGAVNTKTLEQLRTCEVGSWFDEARPDSAGDTHAGAEIPTMEAILDRYGSDVRYYIEIKSPDDDPGMEEALLKLLDDAGLAGPAADNRQVLIQSFSADSLQRLQRLRTELPLVQLLPGPVDASALDAVATYAVAIGPAADNVDAELVAAAHQRCLDVHPYTVDDPAEMDRLLDAGVDGMFTNAPAVLIERRGRRPDPPEHCSGAA